MELINRQAAIEMVAKQYCNESDRMTALQELPVFSNERVSDDSEICIPVETVIEMLKEMQLETAKCQGFFAGHVTQAWVISNMLGAKIKELGGKPYVILNDKLQMEEL